MKTLKQLLDDVQTTIIARKKAESDLAPFKTAYDLAVQTEAQALIALEVFRTSGEIDFISSPKLKIAAQS